MKNYKFSASLFFELNQIFLDDVRRKALKYLQILLYSV